MDFNKRIYNFCMHYQCDANMEPATLNFGLDYRDVNLTLQFRSLLEIISDFETKQIEQHYLKNNHSVKAAYEQYQLVLQLAKNDG